ncbi:hypothetical protein CCUS01_11258 [Colletotrichum cuscutae]|uniref:Uncharacterized protein n=1 Tax=Colletotrichum cuscutae TaxID=1209917 RepID=A0AAI9U3M8_9PEZI|nr:hypothetical protein CCUS01_11258 [Colletotrichum cuscutae]
MCPNAGLRYLGRRVAEVAYSSDEATASACWPTRLTLSGPQIVDQQKTGEWWHALTVRLSAAPWLGRVAVVAAQLINAPSAAVSA